ncbi:MAG: heme lyase CcmF/NrfE family subunit [Gammaproteobacteria bacterium]|nr:heme lyase CcmF/NrfE family subunit [Gammaproteobacteria bacterium]
MIATLGHDALLCACLFAFLQSVVPLYGFFRKNIYALAFARVSAIAQFIFVTLAFLFLISAFILNDFSIAYVAANSHETLPLLYRATAAWGAHEGSILLWVFILNLWTMIFYIVNRWQLRADPQQLDIGTLTLAILGFVSFCFLCFLIFTSNPFLLNLGPAIGQDLNPLLQDPGFVIHPPMLYAGYVGFACTFAITQAALLMRAPPSVWLPLTRRFAVAAWCFLTLGILLGSWWSYRVLGWGGFWFWDPVENASLLPWLAGTALIHILLLAEKRNIGIAWAATLSIFCFLLSLLGTLLVRSGILISAHTFASDPGRGVFLLLMLTSISLLSFLIYLFLPTGYFTQKNSALNLVSREVSLYLNSGLLIIAMLTILLGTLYPILIEALHFQSISVGAPYFNLVMLPLVCLTMIMMVIGPACVWQNQPVTLPWQKVWKKLALSLILTLSFLFFLHDSFDWITTVCVTLAVWVILSVPATRKKHRAMSVAHFGFAIFVLGLALTALLNQEREVRLKPGDHIQLNAYHFLFSDLKRDDGSNYKGIRAEFTVLKNKRYITSLQPEKRVYTVREMVMSKVAIHPGIFRDLYIALGEPLENDYWSVRIYYKPFIRLVWFGGLIMILGGCISLLQRRSQRSAQA